MIAATPEGLAKYGRSLSAEAVIAAFCMDFIAAMLRGPVAPEPDDEPEAAAHESSASDRSLSPQCGAAPVLPRARAPPAAAPRPSRRPGSSAPDVPRQTP